MEKEGENRASDFIVRLIGYGDSQDLSVTRYWEVGEQSRRRRTYLLAGGIGGRRLAKWIGQTDVKGKSPGENSCRLGREILNTIEGLRSLDGPHKERS